MLVSRRSQKGAHFAKANEAPRGLNPTADEEIEVDDAVVATDESSDEEASSEPQASGEELTSEAPSQDDSEGAEPVEKTSVSATLASLLPSIDEEAGDQPSDLDAQSSEETVSAAPDIEGLTTISATEEEKPRKKRRWPLYLAGAATVTVAGAYLAGVVGFDRYYFMPNTTLNGQDVSLVAAADIAEQHSNSVNGYQLSIKGQGLDISIKAADITLGNDGDAFVQEALDQVNPWAWPLQITSQHNLTSTERIVFDESLFSKTVIDAVDAYNKDATKPTDAKVSYDKEKHIYVIEPEKPGTVVDGEKVLAMATEALSTMEPSVELGEDVLVQPAVLSNDPKLKEGVDKVNGQLGAVQKLKVGDKDVFEVGSDLIAGWLKVDEDLKATVDTDAIVKWAQGELSEKLDSVGAQRTFTRPDGKSITVSGGSYGWIIDGESLGKQIAENIMSGTGATIDVPMLQTADTWNPGGQDWGKRYIDIDVSEQHVRLYNGDGNVIWESDCVTGNTTEKHDTPQGVYQINSNKEKGDVVLEGPIDEKTNKPEYVSHVTYWMPFVWNAVALHDATWRYSFGGDIYQTSGSHGCVNLPYDKAAELYDICEVGDVVVVHW